MLFVIENYPFCSFSNQQAIQVLDCLKSSFDMDDVKQLKSFVMRNLKDRSHFSFESGRVTTSMHLGQIVQMALELKSQSGQAPASQQDKEWNEFCETYVRRFEDKWTKKLEDYGKPAEEEEKNGNADSAGHHDIKIPGETHIDSTK